MKVLAFDSSIKSGRQCKKNGFKHLVTYQRALSSKSMPSRNSPTNEAGKTVNTMLWEFVVVCEKK
ncbi:hypothetical protein FACS189413_19460 [Bacteroidia bacterium]|nr:hypothetical protein FACS189413_19460 [Bacteroidia bacterium]